MHDWVENLTPEKNAGDCEVAVYQAHGRVVRVLRVEAREMEHLVCPQR